MGLNAEQIKTFQDKGFVVLGSVFNAAVMKKVSNYLDEMAIKHPGEDGEAMYFERSPVTDENVIVRIEHFLGELNPDLTKLLLPPSAINSLTQLLGEPPVLFKEKINYKPPGCRADKLHQDQAAGWNAYCDMFLTMAIVVDENRKDNAALSFLKSGNYEKHLMSEEWKPLTYDDPPYQPVDDYELLEANPGDVIFFDSYVPHGSPANESSRGRRNIFLTFNRKSDGDMRERYYQDKWMNYAPNIIGDARSHESFRV